MIKKIVNPLCLVIALTAALYNSITIWVLFNAIKGSLTVGDSLFHDLKTPTIMELIFTIIVLSLVIVCCFVVRAKFGGKNDFPFLNKRKKR